MRAVIDRFGLDVPQGLPDYVEQGPDDARDESVPPRADIRAAFIRAHRRVEPAREAAGQLSGEGGGPRELEAKIPESGPGAETAPSGAAVLSTPMVVKVDAPAVQSNRRQTICLCMIVKNEAEVIERCLESVRPILDYWVIADTGSTDGTQEIITRYLRDIPGELHSRPWVDFAHNRSEALALARSHCDYSLIIDADDKLEFTPGFRMPSLGADSYTIEVRNKEIQHWRPHLVRNSLNWRYEGVIHEFLSCYPENTDRRSLPEERNQKRLNGLTLVIGEDGSRRKQSTSERYSRDAQIIEGALRTETDPLLISRYTFYLAQSYLNSGDRDRALENYQKRATLGFLGPGKYS